MMAKKCFESGCINEVEYSCKCSSPETSSCEVHIGKHINLPNGAHNLESTFIQPYEGTKEAILEFLTKENSKYSELRRKIIDFFSQCPFNLKRNLRDFRKKLDDCSGEINDFFAKISQVKKLSKLEQDPILGLLVLQPGEALEKVKLMTIAMKDLYNSARFFYIINEKLASLNRPFVKEKWDSHLENMNVQNTPEVYDKTIESANVKDSINENIESLKGCENLNKPVKKSLENKASLLNSQISIASDNLNSKSNELEIALNFTDTLRNKTAEILSRPNNPELEIDFRTTCSTIQTNSSPYDLTQAYQDYLNAYQLKTSLYNIKRDKKTSLFNIKRDEKINSYLHIYNTETEVQEVKVMQTQIKLDSKTCLTQLPNGKLFCFGNGLLSGITVLIDVNGGLEVLPSGTPCYLSSCIYFNNSIYCFGGKNKGTLPLSKRFDLDRNRWIQLTLLPKSDYSCNSIIFNGNILISGYRNRKLLLYSIDIDSFSSIPYEFAEKTRKILINAERLYLIECPGSIYESEIGSDMNWKRVGKSIIDYDPSQVYCSYNKGGIYISTISELVREYYYFNLDQKIIIDVGYYNAHVSLRRVGKKIVAKKCNNQNFKFDPHYLYEWNLKGKTLNNLGKNLEEIECLDKAIKLNPNDPDLYNKKGDAFDDLEWYLEAIESYDKAIKLDPNDDFLYNNKGEAFSNLKRYLEAIECYDRAIKLNPNKSAFYYDNKGRALNELGRYPEAIESYDEAIKINPNYVDYYNDKGNTLYALERYQEAIQCYDEAINLEPNNPLYLCSRARVFNYLRQEAAALQDFNKAYNLMQENQASDVFPGDEWNLSEKDINFINDLLGRDRIELLKKIQV
ncbi:unnamed protein product [Blepharisma stoltei]|uniref:Tetratricopeptide repeat protein n=1 Tax=Blepharisma stoltei TaxID=1481888 RepID=A0AAU9K9Y4_9CILI|nr:unnamed protein product [Blepharisma stoltei]